MYSSLLSLIATSSLHGQLRTGVKGRGVEWEILAVDYLHTQGIDVLVVVRNTCLGEDRLSRRYWRLQSLPGVVVQEDCCPVGNDGDCTTESGEKWLL
jgi:hypothetical protein